MEEIAQTPNGSVSFDGTASFTISRNGDLVHKMYFEFSPKNTITSFDTIAQANADKQHQLTTYVGNTILKEIECEIGGQKIDRHYGHWLSTWADLTERNPTGEIAQIAANVGASGANTVVSEPGGDGGTIGAKAVGSSSGTGATGGRPTKFQRMSFNHLGLGVSSNSNASAFSTNADNANILEAGSILLMKSQVPLRFWFNRNPGLALPLIALQYHEVKINIKFCSAKDILSQTSGSGATPTIAVAGSGGELKDGKLFVQYIYLDTDERRRFAQVSHEYLIEQLQFQNESSTSGTYTLNFNHPVKEIIWGGIPLPTGTPGGDGSATLNLEAEPPVTGPTVLAPFSIVNNAVTRADGASAGMNGSMAYEFSTQGGNAVNTGTWQLKLNGHDRFEPRPITYFSRQQIYDHHTGFGSVPSKDSILVYSFALKPEEHQPSGTCNFSRIDTAQLVGDSVDIKKGIYVYVVNYNVLRIMSGMGGLAYSN